MNYLIHFVQIICINIIFSELRKMAALLELHRQRGDLFRDTALREILSFLSIILICRFK